MVLPLLVAGASILSSALQGQAQKRAAQAKQRYLQDLDQQMYGNMQVPEYQNIVSSLGGIQGRNQAIGGQLDALGQLGQMAKGGPNAQDEYAREYINQNLGQTQRANREAILNQARAHGTLNSGATLGAQLGTVSQDANAAKLQGLQAAADTRNRALQALGQYGSLASNIRGQSLQDAQAMDAINQFNQQMLGQKFNQQLALNQGRTGLLAGGADSAQQAALAGGSIFPNILNGIASGIGAYGQYQQNQDAINAINAGQGGGQYNSPLRFANQAPQSASQQGQSLDDILAQLGIYGDGQGYNTEDVMNLTRPSGTRGYT